MVLLRRYQVAAVLDLDAAKCQEFPTCEIAHTPRSLASKVKGYTHPTYYVQYNAYVFIRTTVQQLGERCKGFEQRCTYVDKNRKYMMVSYFPPFLMYTLHEVRESLVCLY
jgi:hypothetical protein